MGELPPDPLDRLIWTLQDDAPPPGVLDELANIAQIPPKRRATFEDDLTAIVLVYYYVPKNSQWDKTTKELDSVIKRAQQLIEALDGVGVPNARAVKIRTGLRLTKERKKVRNFEHAVSATRDMFAARKPKWDPFKRFVADAYKVVCDSNGVLTLNKNAASGAVSPGTLPAFIECIRPCMPLWLFPRALSYSALYRIKRSVDQNMSGSA